MLRRTLCCDGIVLFLSLRASLSGCAILLRFLVQNRQVKSLSIHRADGRRKVQRHRSNINAVLIGFTLRISCMTALLSFRVTGFYCRLRCSCRASLRGNSLLLGLNDLSIFTLDNRLIAHHVLVHLRGIIRRNNRD